MKMQFPCHMKTLLMNRELRREIFLFLCRKKDPWNTTNQAVHSEAVATL
jgi:hypothetical protein